MRRQELIRLGFSGNFLEQAYHSRGQTFAWKSGKTKNSPLLFDTEGLEKYRVSKCGLGR